MNSNKISILVNTTDSFEDCWVPFFKLFSTYWPDYSGKIYLNTETKSFDYKGLNIVPVKNNLTGKTWSECLIYALNSIEEDIILYMQDDYFLNNKVNSSLVNNLCKKLIDNRLGCIHLSPSASPGPFEGSSYDDLLRFDKKAGYKISTQASLWRKDLLLKYLRKHENAWQFEIYGTKRAWRNDEEIYIYKFEEKQELIVPYMPTGIVKGKWYKEAVCDLFKDNNINIDFHLRGFHKPVERRGSMSLKKIVNRIKSIC